MIIGSLSIELYIYVLVSKSFRVEGNKKVERSWGGYNTSAFIYVED